MKKWIFFSVALIIMNLNAEPAPDTPAKSPLIIKNSNAITIENKRNPRDCSSCVGSEFKACMRAQTKEDFITNISALHPRACTAYVQQLSGKEIIEIRKLFTVEEWQILPEVFTTAMYEQFKVEQEKAQDAFWDRLLHVLAYVGAFND